MPYESFVSHQRERLTGDVVDELRIDDAPPVSTIHFDRNQYYPADYEHHEHYQQEAQYQQEPHHHHHHNFQQEQPQDLPYHSNHSQPQQQHQPQRHQQQHHHHQQQQHAQSYGYSSHHQPHHHVQPHQQHHHQQQQQEDDLRPSLHSRHSRTPEAPSNPVPPDIHSHPARCPPLNLEFLWKLYHQRTEHENAGPLDLNDQRITTLNDQGFPNGLASLILQHARSMPIRIWLIDNCGTMHKSDGHMVSQSAKGKVDVIHCTRWEEVTSTVMWHAEMAAWQQTPMAVRLLQDPGAQVGPQQLGVSASKHYSSSEEVNRMKSLLKKTRPVGATSPINLHLQELFPSIQSMVSLLQRTDTKITLCVCTDSIPTDADGNEHPQMIEEFLMTLQQLIDWPVQVVWRLSTDEERVVQFYRNLQDTHGGGSSNSLYDNLMVLDDYVSECQHVQEHNPWLNYGYPLHLCREEGIRVPLLDALSERPIVKEELCDMVKLIFGKQICSATADYARFRKKLDVLNKQAGVLWNPIKKKFVPWIDLKKLDRSVDKVSRMGMGGSSSGNGGLGGSLKNGHESCVIS